MAVKSQLWTVIELLFHLRSPAAECLYNKATPLSNYDLSKNPPGQLFSGDAQCKMVFGKLSGLCGVSQL